MLDVKFVVYKKFNNEVKAYAITYKEKQSLVDGLLWVRDIHDDKFKKFKSVSILSEHSSFKEAADEADKRQSDYEINTQPVEYKVCFTGFAKFEKSKLIAMAQNAGWQVVRDVTKNLTLLVCGSNAGTTKLAKADEQKVMKVRGTDGFANFLETGECE